MVAYPYTAPEQQKSKQPYPFVEYGGKEFLRSYLETRKQALEKIAPEIIGTTSILAGPDEISVNYLNFNQPLEINQLLWALLGNMETEGYLSQPNTVALFKSLRKKGELGKLKASYLGPELKPNSGALAGINDYIILSACLCRDYEKTRTLQSLSTLLKTNDRIIAFLPEIKEFSLAHNSISREISFVKNLQAELSSTKIRERLIPANPQVLEKQVLSNLGMVVQDKVRARAYLQAMAAAGLLPGFVIILEDQKPAEELDKSVEGIAYFNSAEPLATTINKLGIPFKIILAKDFNEPAVLESLKERPEEYFIFSGSGILKEILTIGKKMIHAHPGRLPDFKGSTTFLYSLLAEGQCGVATFIMNEGIDAGDVLLMDAFPPPEKNIDISRIYDPYIRSQLIVKTVKLLLEKGFLEGKRQDPTAGETYFMIHPVLRTLAVGYYTEDIKRFKF